MTEVFTNPYMLPVDAIKETGNRHASTEAINKFAENYTNIPDTEILKLVVTDEQHALLSPDEIIPFKDPFFGQEYPSVMIAYNALAQYGRELNNVNLMLALNQAKFEQDKEARKILLDTHDPIVYMSNETFWGMLVPEFIGENIMGAILINIRESLRNPVMGMVVL